MAAQQNYRHDTYLDLQDCFGGQDNLAHRTLKSCAEHVFQDVMVSTDPKLKLVVLTCADAWAVKHS